VLALAERIDQHYPASGVLFSFRFGALGQLGRWAEVKALAQARLSTSADDLRATRAMRWALASLGDFAGVGRLCEGLLGSGRGNASDYNECAWATLFVDSPRERGIEWARRAAELSKRQRWSILHTLASVYAEAERPGEAREIMLEALELDGHEDPEPADWFVFGRIAESYGLEGVAVAAYGRVTEGEGAESTWALTQRRLTGLRGRAAKGRGVSSAANKRSAVRRQQ
jgi:hypothetical protein